MPHANPPRVVAIQSICLAVATVAAFATVAVTFTQMISTQDQPTASADVDAPVRIAAVLDEPRIVPAVNTTAEPSESPVTVEVEAKAMPDVGVDMDMEEPTAQRVFAEASPAVVAIIVRNADAEVIAQATGFIVSPDGLIVTARSAMKGVHSAAAVLDTNAQLAITRVVAQDKVSDLVLLATDGRNLPHLSLSPAGAPAVGSRVYAVAAPPRFDHTICEALVSGYMTPTGEPAAAARVRLGTELESAAIGAPLLDSDSHVVGVATGIDTMTHATMATPAMILTEMLEAIDEDADEPDGPIASIAAAFADLSDPLPAPQPEGAAGATLFDGNPASTFGQKPSGKTVPIETAATSPQQRRDRAAEALVPYVGTELQPESRDAIELGLRLAAIQERLEAMGPTLRDLSVQAFEMADAADRIAQRNPNTRVGDRAIDMKLRGSHNAFVARQASFTRNRLDTQHDYERHVVNGGPEGFKTYLRAREVAAIPAGWLRLPAWVGTGKGLSVSPPIRVKRSYAPARYTPPAFIPSPGDAYDTPRDAPVQEAPKVLD